MMNFRYARKRIEPILTATVKERGLRGQILNTKEGRMKFKEDIIDRGKLMNGDQIFLRQQEHAKHYERNNHDWEYEK